MQIIGSQPIFIWTVAGPDSAKLKVLTLSLREPPDYLNASGQRGWEPLP